MLDTLPALSKSFFLFCLILFFAASAALSQTVTGTVRDWENKAVTGATIAVKGTTKVTVTDSDGNFTINAVGTDILVISFVGHRTQEIALNGRSSLSVNLIRGEGADLAEVVVTSLGIRRQSKKLGYSAT